MESIALGVPAVTTDLSGFGAYVERHIDRSEEQGVLVLHRRDKSFEDSAEHLARYIADFAQLTRRQRIELRNRVERLSELFDWSVLIRHYTEAHDLALERTAGGRPGRLEIRVV
jgi:glycogen(starch) synthase